MKLKLAIQGPLSVLSVNETIEVAQISVLKAGITKLFAGGKKLIVLDLTGTDPKTFQNREVLVGVVALRNWGRDNGGRVLLASGIRGLGDAATVAACAALLADTASTTTATSTAGASPAAATAVAAKPAAAPRATPLLTPEARETALAQERAALYSERAQLQKKLKPVRARPPRCASCRRRTPASRTLSSGSRGSSKPISKAAVSSATFRARSARRPPP